MKLNSIIAKIITGVSVWMLLGLLTPARAQQNNASEVYLSFQYQGVVSVYVTTYYKNNQFYLPVNELFNDLKIDHKVDQGHLSISGTYSSDKKYLLDFKRQLASYDGNNLQLSADDFLIKEVDYFVKPEVLKKIFGLDFTTDFNNLTLSLSTKDKMPVIAQFEREQKRKKLNRDKPLYKRSFYPLKYDRNYSALDGVFLDYNLSGIYTNNSQLYTFNNAIGGEFLGGDLEGNIFGAFSDQQNSVTTNGLRWRFVQRNNRYFSSAIVGQTTSEGISNRAFTGIKISNKPVEPRLLFDRFPINGNVTPQSEVELYLNNQLVDYQKADESGNYRFVVPLTYGSTNYSIRAYTPSGQLTERSSHIQIPFDYLPKGQVDYSISGGRLDNPILGTMKRGYLGEASVASGLSNWLTAKVSSEYLSEFNDNLPSFTGTLNARLFTNYLISANANSENFYRFSSSVVYNNGASWSLSYDYNPGNSRLYNVGGTDQQGILNLFTPFHIGRLPLNVRLLTTYRKYELTNLYRYRVDLNSRLGKLNVRLGYQDQQVNELDLITTPASRITNSYTYSLGRYRSMPALLRTLFIRGELSYLPGLSKMEEVELQLSRDFFNTGRLKFTAGHNFLGDFNSIGLNLIIDFNKIRSNTTTQAGNSNFTFTQNFRGSIGYYPNGDQLLLNNRQQVGQAGAAVRLYVDNNNNRAYDDSLDTLIKDPAVHLNRSGGRTKVKNGINYISQLLPYYRYDLEVDRGKLKNPLLIPNVQNFSIVTDPDQYKTIDIPFYLSGVISGKVEKKRADGSLKDLSGVRLYLKSADDSTSTREPFSKELRTFSDGSFYTYEVPPGKYHLFIDPEQMNFLDAVSKPDTMDIKVKALAEGDFIEGLTFVVIPKSAKNDTVRENDKSSFKKTKKQESSDNTPEPKDTAKKQHLYQIQMASFQTMNYAKKYADLLSKTLNHKFYTIYNISNGLFAVRSFPAGDRKAVVRDIITYHETGRYPEASLVNLPLQTKSLSEQTFIQIAAFRSKKNALRFSEFSKKKLNKDISVVYSNRVGLYKVYIKKTATLSEHKLRKFLGRIRSTQPFTDAFIYGLNKKENRYLHQKEMAFSFQIQVYGTEEKMLPASMTSLAKSFGAKIVQRNKGLITIKNIETWSTAKLLRKRIIAASFSAHPIIVLVENE